MLGFSDNDAFNTAVVQTTEPWLYEKIWRYIKIGRPIFIVIALLNVLLILFLPETITIFV